MATALEVPNFLIAPISDHRSGARIFTEEMFADESAIFCLIRLEITIERGVHDVHERTFAILGEQLIPFATPYDFDDIPTSATKERFQLLDDFAVTTYWSIKSLQVAIDDKR
ncbi:unannotated protein [freshwater metagenome]|uniref:Unannotated protein n=1 Tax=freshwater metagenome TaxID=449393 RepID=A0A6J6CQ50_9ZZZZ